MRKRSANGQFVSIESDGRSLVDLAGLPDVVAAAPPDDASLLGISRSELASVGEAFVKHAREEVAPVKKNAGWGRGIGVKRKIHKILSSSQLSPEKVNRVMGHAKMEKRALSTSQGQAAHLRQTTKETYINQYPPVGLKNISISIHRWGLNNYNKHALDRPKLRGRHVDVPASQMSIFGSHWSHTRPRHAGHLCELGDALGLCTPSCTACSKRAD